jgi:Mg/Co/Ni transporter MgtE
VYPTGRGRVKLSDQHPDLQAVVRYAIGVVVQQAIMENAFPPVNSRVEHTRSALISGAKEKRAYEIMRRLKKDNLNRFVRDLEELVRNHLLLVHVLMIAVGYGAYYHFTQGH